MVCCLCFHLSLKVFASFCIFVWLSRIKANENNSQNYFILKKKNSIMQKYPSKSRKKNKNIVLFLPLLSFVD